MADQIDARFESILRGVLKTEATRLPMTVTAGQIMERRVSRPRAVAWPTIRSRRMFLAMGGSAAVLAAVVLGLGVALNQEGNIATSPTPSASPSPSADLGIFAPIAGWIVYENPYLSSRDVIWAIDPRSTDGGSEIALTFEPGDPLGWSGDGTRLLIQGEDHLSVLDADGTKTVVTDQPVGIRRAAISPDGKLVAFAGQTSTGKSALFLVDANGGQAEVLWESQAGSIRAPAFSPDGALITYVDGAGDHGHSVWVINVDGTDPRQIVTSDVAHAGHVNGMAWAPADRIALGFAGSIYTFSPDGSDFTSLVGSSETCSQSECSTVLPAQAAWPHWSPDGSQIAYKTGCLSGATSGDERGCQLAIADADGSNVRLLRNGRPGPWHPGNN